MLNKKIIAGLVGLLLVAPATAAYATDEPTQECPPIIVVDEEAWTEEIVHPAVTEVIHHEAVTETVPGVWANWAPNNTQGPQDYVPIWPVDERGTWIVHDQGVPPGHEGPDGVYQKGGGNSPWFYRQAEKVIVITEAYDEVVVISEEWIEYIEHPEVTHEEPGTCEPPVEPPVVDPPVVDPPVVHPPVVHEPKEPREPKVPTVVDSGL